MRCRAAFTFTNRKHHCRNCGQVFDQACSSRNMPIPRFGITQHVRVCEGCYIKSGAGVKPPALPANRTPRSRRDMDADLQRAIELSLAESNKGAVVGSEPPLMARSGAQMEDDDEEFRMAIEASLRESERARPSAPNGIDEHEFKVRCNACSMWLLIWTDVQPLPTFDLSPREAETILTFSSVIDQATAYGERDLRRFPHAHDLYAQAYAIGGKLQRNVEEKGTKQRTLNYGKASLLVADGNDRNAWRNAAQDQRGYWPLWCLARSTEGVRRAGEICCAASACVRLCTSTCISWLCATSAATDGLIPVSVLAAGPVSIVLCSATVSCRTATPTSAALSSAVLSAPTSASTVHAAALSARGEQ